MRLEPRKVGGKKGNRENEPLLLVSHILFGTTRKTKKKFSGFC